MRISTIGIFTALGVVLSIQPAMAASCYDLWYERNAIYDQNGFCFSSALGQQTFDNGDCWTKNVQFTPDEQYRIDQLKDEEDRRGCKVN
jgi:hypothetical protein